MVGSPSQVGSFVLGVAKDSVGSFAPVLLALVLCNGLLCLLLCLYVLRPAGGARGGGGEAEQPQDESGGHAVGLPPESEIPSVVIRACSSSSALDGEAV